MDWNRFFASLLVLSLAPVAVTAQTPALDSGASAHVDFTIAQKQTIYQSISKTQKNNAAPVGFRPAVGVIMPNGVDLAPVCLYDQVTSILQLFSELRAHHHFVFDHKHSYSFIFVL